MTTWDEEWEKDLLCLEVLQSAAKEEFGFCLAKGELWHIHVLSAEVIALVTATLTI